MRIKKLLAFLLALIVVTFSSCGKDPEDPSNPSNPSNPETPEMPTVDYAADYVGDYALNVLPALIIEVDELGALAIGGSEYTEDCMCKIEKTTDENEVQLILFEGRDVAAVIEGYCDESGLHLNPFSINISFTESDEEIGEITLELDMNLNSTSIAKPYAECLGFSCVSPVISANSVTMIGMGMNIPLSGNIMGSITFEGTRN